MKAYRQGDVVIRSVKAFPKQAKELSHCVLAEGESTGHKHQIIVGEAALYKHKGTLYLRVDSETATLIHEEHKPIMLPQGEFEIVIQREYIPSGWENVRD